jgi:hypothetical protein
LRQPPKAGWGDPVPEGLTISYMGFIRQQEIRAAVRFLQWQYEKQKMPVPGIDQLNQQAARIVDEAHRIAKERGRNVLGIVRELVEEIKKR